MKIKFTVTVMTCAACSARGEKVSGAVAGVHSADVNLLKGTMVLEADNETIIPAVVKAIQAAGYDAFPAGQKPVAEPKEDPLSNMKIRIIGSVAFLTVLMYFTMGHMIGLPVPHWYHGTNNAVVAALLQLLLTRPVVYLNRSYYTRGLKALWHRSANMDSLIAVGSLAALIYGDMLMIRCRLTYKKKVYPFEVHLAKNMYNYKFIYV